ncbi:trehalose 6-phosphate phosphatase (plasmid) [Deinococcus aetherius]|uniref:Trehalose 6-phosphate phosphatase n=1 Tax=Deinococcus aetherius TaxID=200252 RepID=A0ABM8AK67_9DEIO|nr:trehalose-phosphatase [Deinococcus aetherius]BDP44212.1 trehalose 6-phosphate phosphatase [Deinococcus aetherius]
MTLPQELLRLGERPLLVLCDYDGTLAPIVARPEEAWPEPGAREALERLLAHPRHCAAVLTGRRATEVHAFLNLPDFSVIGLHGMEWPGEAAAPPDTDAVRRITAQLPDVPGLRLEDKGWTLAVHYREVPELLQAGVEARLAEIALPVGWELMAGKKVREFRPGGFGKGRAVQRLARRFPNHLPVFLGDDVTDEEAFEALRGEDGLTIKVGDGPTLAEHQVEGPGQVVALLERWADLTPLQ